MSFNVGAGIYKLQVERAPPTSALALALEYHDLLEFLGYLFKLTGMHNLFL